MMPLQATPTETSAGGSEPAAVSLRLTRITKRSDFQRASRALHTATPGFVLQMRRRECSNDKSVRVGFTCSKKVGNAVARNRAKRRLREIALLELQKSGQAGTDYVLIGRAKETAQRPFSLLLSDLRGALEKLHKARR